MSLIPTPVPSAVTPVNCEPSSGGRIPVKLLAFNGPSNDDAVIIPVALIPPDIIAFPITSSLSLGFVPTPTDCPAIKLPTADISSSDVVSVDFNLPWRRN